MPYDIAQSEWNTTVSEITSILSNHAKTLIGQETISYSELYELVRHLVRSSPILGPEDHRFHEMLGDVSKNENQAGRGMLSVLVVHKSGDMKPGPGFYELAQKLGYVFSDEDSFWIRQFNIVCKAWRE